MSYSCYIKPSCKRDIRKLCKKNAELRRALEDKIAEVIKNPLHYKPLKYELAGERRVHIVNNPALKGAAFLQGSDVLQTSPIIGTQGCVYRHPAHGNLDRADPL